MTEKHTTVSPLRQRMIDDMTLRRLEPKTQSNYILAVKKLTRFLGRSPDTASADDLRRFQLHLVESGAGNSSVNATVTALRFFFGVTLDRDKVTRKLSGVQRPRTLPVVLTAEEVTLFLRSALGLKYKATLSTAYGAGLRAAEIVGLKITDIDSKRMILRVEQGKGRKDRNAMLSPALLSVLREWYREARSRGKMLPNGGCFPDRTRSTHYQRVSSIAPVTRRHTQPVSTSGYRCTR